MSKPIFNSLGSNYTFESAMLSAKRILHPNREHDNELEMLCVSLHAKLDGAVLPLYKGRDAIEFALRIVGLDHDNGEKKTKKKLAVLTQGLACHAIEEAIVRAGMVPLYVDLEKNTLSPSVKTLQNAFERAEKNGFEVCAILVQHTLGYANPVQEVRQFCDKEKVIFIEDLAQSFGALDATGEPLGSRADIVICSFGRDKVIDAVSGGAVVIRKKGLFQFLGEVAKQLQLPTQHPPVSYVRKELFYPVLTYSIRSTFSIGVGKILFQVAKKMGLLPSPVMSPTTGITNLPAGYAPLIDWQLEHLQEQLAHRREIAAVYFKGFQNVEELMILAKVGNLHNDMHLRFPLLCESTDQLKKIISTCTAHNIHLTDRWYREVVDSGSLHLPSQYVAGTCPVAEDVATRLLNLPTHRQITPKDAEWIVETIKKTFA